jgi:hypothetical protein
MIINKDDNTIRNYSSIDMYIPPTNTHDHVCV